MILNNPLFGFWPVLLSTSVLKDRDIDLTNHICITKVENSSYCTNMQIGKSRHWELNPYPPFPTAVIHGSPQLTGRGTELLCNRPTVQCVGRFLQIYRPLMNQKSHKMMMLHCLKIFVVQLLSHVWLFATPHTGVSRLLCPPLSPRVCWSSCSLSW